jgi:methyl-accepting chemotaxis protein
VVQARKEMTDEGAAIVSLSDALYQIQLDRRDAESDNARTLQLVSTLLALLVGIIAAVVITRQITGAAGATLAVVDRIASGDLSHDVQSRAATNSVCAARHRAHGRDPARPDQWHDGVTQIASAAEECRP